MKYKTAVAALGAFTVFAALAPADSGARRRQRGLATP